MGISTSRIERGDYRMAEEILACTLGSFDVDYVGVGNVLLRERQRISVTTLTHQMSAAYTMKAFGTNTLQVSSVVDGTTDAVHFSAKVSFLADVERLVASVPELGELGLSADSLEVTDDSELDATSSDALLSAHFAAMPASSRAAPVGMARGRGSR